MMLLSALNARMGTDGCRKAGWIRIVFATLSILDRLLLHLDLDLFLSPTHGLLPISQEKVGLWGMLSLLRFVQDSDALLWSLHYLGLFNAVLLLLGIAPRWNALLLFLNNCSFDNANWMLCDGVDTGLNPMVRLFNFHLLLLPLHHITIYDGFGFGRMWRGKTNASNNSTSTSSTENTDSWPMWTVWLWQWETVLIYFGAMVGKFDGDVWVSGNAMYYVMHCTDECIGIYNPDFLFNRALPSKLMTWGALGVEFLAPFTIWFCGIPRNITLFATTMLLIGMDVSMNMSTFEWYGILGWSLFLIQRQDYDHSESSKSSVKRRGISYWRVLLDGSVFVFVIVSASSMALPLRRIRNVTPHWFSEIVAPVADWNTDFEYDYVRPVAELIGIQQGVWTLYSGGYDGSTVKLSVEAVLHNGTILTWHSPKWQDLGRWEHKLLYNHMAYYKHLPDCDDEDDYMCEEQESLYRKLLKDGAFGDVQESELVSLTLWEEEEYPPPPPENLGWWDTLKQPLITSERKELSWMDFGSEEDEDFEGDDMSEEDDEDEDFEGDEDEDFEDDEDEDDEDEFEGDEDDEDEYGEVDEMSEDDKYFEGDEMSEEPEDVEGDKMSEEDGNLKKTMNLQYKERESALKTEL